MRSLAYTKTPPAIEGMYWYLAEPEGDPNIVRVFKDADGYWSVQYDNLHLPASKGWSDAAFDDHASINDGVDYVENHSGLWAGPIPVPKKPS